MNHKFPSKGGCGGAVSRQRNEASSNSVKMYATDIDCTTTFFLSVATDPNKASFVFQKKCFMMKLTKVMKAYIRAKSCIEIIMWKRYSTILVAHTPELPPPILDLILLSGCHGTSSPSGYFKNGCIQHLSENGTLKAVGF